MKNARILAALLLIVTLGSLPVRGESLEPLTVSPGATDHVSGVEARCPTFSWQAVPGAVGYEVVVYELPPQTEVQAWSLDDAVEVLFVDLPSGVTGWTPSLERGLARGADHVWFVRGVFGDFGLNEVDGTEWSAARFFRVAGVPTHAVPDLVTRERVGGSGTGSGSGSGSMGARSRITEAGAGRSAMAKRVGEKNAKDVGTAMAAIRGEIPDATGETYGVVGISNSLEGGGLGAVNTTEGPDLVLDGAANGRTDANLFDWGLDRSSPDVEIFGFTNEEGGTIDVWVGGDVHARALFGGGADVTDVDAVSLDGQDGAFYLDWGNLVGVPGDLADGDNDTLVALAPSCESWQVPKWNGSQWVCWWDADALAALGCATGEVAKWDGSNWVCADDEQVSVTAGPGIIIDNGEVRIDPAAFSTRISTLDTVSDVGLYPSIAIGADGLGLISYYDSNNQDLKVAHCADTVCSSADIATLDSANAVGLFTSIAIGADGLGLISYYDSSFDDLKVAHCVDTACTSAAIATLDTSGDVGKDTSIAIGTDGFGLISYFDGADGHLKVAHCADTACASATIATLDSSINVGRDTSIAIGTDGLGLISYRDDAIDDLKVAHCNNAACTNADIATLDTLGDVGKETSIAIGTDGLGLISYRDESSDDLKVAHCDDAACTSAAIATLDSAGAVGYQSSIAIGADGLGLISYYDLTNNDLKVARCGDTICSIATSTILDSEGHVGYYSSIAIGSDGLGLIAYMFDDGADLRAAHLGIGSP